MSKISAPAPAICWFRDELRLADKSRARCCDSARADHRRLYVHDEASPGVRAMGGAARCGCIIRWQLSPGAWKRLARRSRSSKVRPKPSYPRSPRRAVQASSLEPALRPAGTRHRCPHQDCAHGAGDRRRKLLRPLLAEPWTVKTQSGTPFRVFSPFFRTLSAMGDPPAPLPPPRRIKGVPPADIPANSRVDLDDLSLLPRIPWDAGMSETWTPARRGAHARFEVSSRTVSRASRKGATARTSRTSRACRRICGSAKSARARSGMPVGEGRAGDAKGSRQIPVRSRLAGVSPTTCSSTIPTSRRATSRHASTASVGRCAQGPRRMAEGAHGRADRRCRHARTLGHTGYMHNRVRMIVASFLVKHLLVDWRRGEAWFWDTLCDADVANNPASWQWVAGSGADAAPYFRVFNPVLQAAKFDPDGRYIRRWVPEIAKLPVPHCTSPGRRQPPFCKRPASAWGTRIPIRSSVSTPDASARWPPLPRCPRRSTAAPRRYRPTIDLAAPPAVGGASNGA